MAKELPGFSVARRNRELQAIYLLLKWGCIVAIFLGFLALAVDLISPLGDGDLWWHLATGRHLLQTGQILNEDPFGIAGAQITPGRELVLKGYWLSQILFYGVYRAFGLMGIVCLRATLLLVPPVATLVFGWRRYPWSPVVALLALVSGWAMLSVSGVRPNHLTVAFVPLLLILLLGIKHDSECSVGNYPLGKVWLLPLFMLIWANMHGGFLAGVAIIFLFVSGETVSRYRRGEALRPSAYLWIVALVAVLATLLTPVGTLPYTQYLSFQGGFLSQRTSEYLSPFTLVKRGLLVYWPYFILLIASIWLLARQRFRVPATKLLLVIAWAGISLTAFRYTPLFVGVVVILLLPDFQNLYDVGKNSFRLSTLFVTVLLTVFLVFQSVSMFPQRVVALSANLVDTNRFPVAAIDFLEEQKLSGVFFNLFNWGGYLAWRQLGESKNFVDSRSLNLPLVHAYTRVLWLPDEAQKILDEYQVSLILVPRLNRFTGELYPLTDFLWRSSEWLLVYRDETAMVLARDKNFADLGAVQVNKSIIYQDVVRDVERELRRRPDNAYLHKAMSFANARLLQGAKQF